MRRTRIFLNREIEDMKQPEPFGKYLLLGQVAVGGMAEIYKARYADPSMPQMDIALKRILPSYTEDESFVTMFKDEGNIAIRLKHPNIVNVYDVGEVNNDWYIAMEFIHGTDIRVLSDACEKYNKRFSPTQVARVVCETAKALYYAHNCTAADGTPLNIVHRDCTPHNIMVSEEGVVKLMDFGIAKAASRATKTRVGTVKGKSSYMSPEQAHGKQLDGRSDMFTLGTVGWELLTGYRLFKASSDFEILTKVLKSEIPHPSDIDSNIPRELGDIMMKTLERNRDMRYEHCGELADTLENWINMNGDGSDRQLGNMVLCLMNRKGHSSVELPNYTPGYSLYDCEDGQFTRKAGAAGMPSSPAAPAQPAPSPAQSGGFVSGMNSSPMNPAVSPGMPQPGFGTAPGFPSAPGFPDPNAALGANNPPPKVPVGYFILFVVLLCISVGAIIGGVKIMTGEAPETPTFVAPEAHLSFKTRPTDAIVYLNDKPVLDSDDKPKRTPIYAHKARLGDKFTIRFEKDGYEPVTIERHAVLLEQDIEVEMVSEADARAAKMDYVPEYKITTDPSGLAVTVNGESLGKSPVIVSDAKFGSELKIEVAGDSDYEGTSQVVVVARGSDQTNIVLERIEKKAARGGGGGGGGGGSAARPKQPKAPAAAASAGSGYGTITVKATPWATVSIDSQRIGNTPINGRKVKAGSHKIDMRLPPKNLSVSKTVTVKSDQDVSVGYNFNTGKWM